MCWLTRSSTVRCTSCTIDALTSVLSTCAAGVDAGVKVLGRVVCVGRACADQAGGTVSARGTARSGIRRASERGWGAGAATRAARKNAAFPAMYGNGPFSLKSDAPDADS